MTWLVIEQIVVIILVAGAAFYFVRRVIKSFASPKSSCSGCDKASLPGSCSGCSMDKEAARLFDAISRRTGKTIGDFGLSEEGDRIIIAVSGGKDSLSLLEVMAHRKAVAPFDFEIMAVHVDMGLPGLDLSKFEGHVRQFDMPYKIIRSDIFRETQEGLNCFWCSWNRRKLLFEFATKNGWPKIAFAHHMDDIVETLLINQLFKGEVATMCPRQVLFDGKLTIVRPFACESEEMISRFALARGLASFATCQCPVGVTTQRAAIKKFLSEMARVTPAVKQNLFNSLMNIQAEYLPRIQPSPEKVIC